MSTNQTRRAAAERAGEATFRYERVEDWPGCTDCGQIIMRNVDGPAMVGGRKRPGLYRACGCSDRVWWMPPGGGAWERVPGT